MDDEINKIVEEISQKHELADIFISLFFASLDILLYLVIICMFGCDFTAKFFTHRRKLSLLIILDACIRIINLYITSFIYSLNREIFFTAFSTFQFFLILTILNQIFQDNNISELETAEIKLPFLTSIFFFIFAITLNNSKLVSLIQYTLAIIAILAYTYYIKGNIYTFLSSIRKKKENFEAKNFIYNLPLFIMLYFIIYYFLKIVALLIENKLYCSYMEMACDLFKEVGKYLCFSMVITIYYLYNKYIKREDYEYDSDVNQGSVKIISISSSKYN